MCHDLIYIPTENKCSPSVSTCKYEQATNLSHTVPTPKSLTKQNYKLQVQLLRKQESKNLNRFSINHGAETRGTAEQCGCRRQAQTNSRVPATPIRTPMSGTVARPATTQQLPQPAGDQSLIMQGLRTQQ
jgi:hypothetical protein